jgi:hypothetical protein
MGAEAMVTGDNRVLTSSCEVLGTNPMVGLAASGQVAIVEEHVTNSCSVLPNPGLLEDGPDRAGLVCGANGPIGAASISLGGVNEEIAEVGLQKAFDPNPYLNGGTAGMQLGKGQMIDNFDLLVQKTRGSQCAESFILCQQTNLVLVMFILPTSKQRKIEGSLLPSLRYLVQNACALLK